MPPPSVSATKARVLPRPVFASWMASGMYSSAASTRPSASQRRFQRRTFPYASGTSASQTTGADMCRCGSTRQATGSTAAHADPGRSRSFTAASSASVAKARNEFGFQTRSPNSALHGENASSTAANAAAASPNGRRSANQNIQTDAAPSSSKNTLPASGARVKQLREGGEPVRKRAGKLSRAAGDHGPSIGKRAPCAMSMPMA